MRSILVPVADRPECAVALTSAFQLAKRLSANVHGCHIRPHVKERQAGRNVVPYKLDTDSDWTRFLDQDAVSLHSKAAHEFFQRLAKEQEFTCTTNFRYLEDRRSALWHEMKGSPEKVMSIIGPVSDLLVVTRPESSASVRARSFMLSALMQSGRPVLLLPNKSPVDVGHRMLIAWNQSHEAMAAVVATLPLLMRADEVHILSCGEEYRLGPQARHLHSYLEQWNIDAKLIQSKGDDVESELVNTYIDINADLVVMGAYSRGHLRETLFGGLTHHVLNNTVLPTLMLHR